MLKSLSPFLNAPGLVSEKDKIQTYEILKAIMLSIWVMLGVMAFGAIFVFVQKSAAAINILTLLVFLLISRTLIRHNRARLACAVFIFGLWWIITVSVYLSGGLDTVHSGGYLGLTVTTGILLGSRAGLFVAAISIVAAVVFVELEMLGIHPPRYFPNPPYATLFNLCFVFGLAVPALVIALKGLNDRLLTARQEAGNRKKSEEALRESEQELRRIIENLQDPLYKTDMNGAFTYLSPASERLAGYKPEDLIGRHIAEFFIDPSRREDFVNLVLRNGYVTDYEAEWKHRNGSLVWISTNAQLLRDEEGNPTGVEGIARNITERKRAEDQIRASLKEKEVLLREIHHRVKNNLAVINSLLRLQSRRTTDETHRVVLEDANKRVMSMALAHELLYRSKNLAVISMSKYITKLVDHLVGSSLVTGNAIRVMKEITEITLNLDTAVPLGFLITELVTNCLKHAFPETRDGEIVLSLHPVNEKAFELVVADNGIGIPNGVDPANSTSLGLSLVNTFVKQLDGEIEIIRENGTEVRINFREVE